MKDKGAVLKARCLFLGINPENMNNTQRAAAIKEATHGVPWPMWVKKKEDCEKYSQIARQQRGIVRDKRAKQRSERQEARRKERESRKIKVYHQLVATIEKNIEKENKRLERVKGWIAEQTKKVA